MRTHVAGNVGVAVADRNGPVWPAILTAARTARAVRLAVAGPSRERLAGRAFAFELARADGRARALGLVMLVTHAVRGDPLGDWTAAAAVWHALDALEPRHRGRA